jgi:hypothetical protein
MLILVLILNPTLNQRHKVDAIGRRHAFSLFQVSRHWLLDPGLPP